VGFVVGFPVIVTLALHQEHEEVGFLAADFKAGTLNQMWEVVDLVKKLLLSSAVLFVPQGSIERIAIALLISATFQVLQAYHQPYNSPHKNAMADATGVALSLTYFLTLLVEASPLAKNKEALGVLLLLLMAFVLLASVVALVAMRRQAEWVLRRKRASSAAAQTVEMGEVHASVANPAYEAEGDSATTGGVAEHTHKSGDLLRASALRVVELEAELALVKREQGEYTSARITAELQKVQAAHAAELEDVVQAERERCAAEAAALRAELTQLKCRRPDLL
jgi:hypothetical protein